MKIKFKFAYCGRETAMIQYDEGQEVEFPFPQAQELVLIGVADEVEKVEKKKKKEVIDEPDA